MCKVSTWWRAQSSGISRSCEAAKHVSPELGRRYPDVRWGAITGLRNVVVHAYFSLDWTIVPNDAVEDMPLLRDQLVAILADLTPPD